MQYFLCCCDKYIEIKMCDLEPFSKIQLHITYVYHMHNATVMGVYADTLTYVRH